MKILTKQDLIDVLRGIRSRGWVRNLRPGNAGAVGNTLEDLLGIQENNLPIPNAAEWELKCQRIGTSSLITLFHMEPSPRAMKFVSNILLPKYGWPHKEAGTAYSEKEMSFRQTLNALSRTDRGFGIVVDRRQRKLLISFDARCVDQSHNEWLISVKERGGHLDELTPQPYWGFDDLFHKAGTKLLNCFFVKAEVKREKGREFFRYSEIMILEKFSLEKLINAVENGYILIDFDARTGHNHGTKFRLRQDSFHELYEKVMTIK